MVNGWGTCETVLGYKIGQMVRNMMEIGRRIIRVGRESSGMLMEIFVIFYSINIFQDDGEWNDDKANGFGIYIHVNGAKYDGYWQNDLQDGFGVETWADGSKYEGEYVEGQKNGEGKYIWPDGSSYEGKWKGNKICGNGIYVWMDGRKVITESIIIFNV